MSTTTTIVVGAGTSGGALAARLSEDEDHHVILIEAGPDYPEEGDLPEALRDAYNPQLVGHDWGFEGYSVDLPGDRPAAPYPRGRLVGGSGAVNGTVGQRATREDFAGWVAAGNDEWSWDAVLPLYRRLERDLDYGDSAVHGGSGPVPITRLDRDRWPSVSQAFEQACLERGHPPCEDANALDVTGIGPTPRNMTGPLRASSLVTYLRAARGRPNLEIRANTLVERVVFAGRRATGVEIRLDGGSGSERIQADRVVLCAGAVKSPHLLMLSGIGPAGPLRRVGIEPLVDLPVGRTLIDHPSFPVLGLAADTSEEPLWGLRVELQYTSDGGPRNDMLMVPALLEPSSMMFEVAADVTALVLLGGVIAKPRSTGELNLTSSDPSVQPELRLNFLANRADVDRAKELVRLMYEMARSSPIADEVREILVPTADIVGNDDQLVEWLRQTVATVYHATSSCRMGPRDDSRAVVSQRLAVHDTECLYVADASVMPEIPTGMTNLTCYMIGERMSDLLRAGE